MKLYSEIMFRLNPSSGHPFWGIGKFIGMVGMLVFIFFALPLVAYFMNIEQVGQINGNTFIAYSFWILNEDYFDYYFLTIFFGGILVAKLSMLIHEVSNNYASGLIYDGHRWC